MDFRFTHGTALQKLVRRDASVVKTVLVDQCAQRADFVIEEAAVVDDREVELFVQPLGRL